MSTENMSLRTSELERLLPRCAVCLQDYSVSSEIAKLPCGHVFCGRCRSKLVMASGEFRCVFDRKTYPEVITETSESLKTQIDSFLRQFQAVPPTPEEANSVLEKIIGHVNTSKVPCKDLFISGLCTSAAECPYSHASSNMELVRKVQSYEQNSPVWECKNCLLTVSNKLVRCPVCGLEQGQSLLIPQKPQVDTGNNESRSALVNQTMDHSPVGDNEKPRIRTVVVDETTCVGGKDNLERILGPERSVCCVLQ